MQNAHSEIFTRKGTHPMLTLMLFTAVITGVVASGSYFSKQHNVAREMEAALKAPINTMASVDR
jgi:hypothetical protein